MRLEAYRIDEMADEDGRKVNNFLEDIHVRKKAVHCFHIGLFLDK
jgi:hypothetical protein